MFKKYKETLLVTFVIVILKFKIIIIMLKCKLIKSYTLYNDEFISSKHSQEKTNDTLLITLPH